MPATRWLMCALLAGCTGAPERQPPALRSAQTVWTRYLSPAAMAADVGEMLDDADAASHELSRLPRLPTAAAALASLETGRAAAALALLDRAVAAESARTPHALARAQALAPRLAGDPIAAGAIAPTVLGLDRTILPEPTDARHRTEPGDDAPAPSLWERLRRRLRL